MKDLKYIVIILLLSATFLSCEKEIDLELKSATPRLVIDASISAVSSCNVQLSMTKDYWDQNDLPKGVSGATITIHDSKGNKETLTEVNGNGFYTSNMQGVVAEKYTLTVEVDGEIYTATEELPAAVPIIDIGTYKLDTGGDAYFFPTISFKDPIEVDNYYLYRLTINNHTMQGTQYEDDKNSNGKDRDPILFFDKKENNDEELKLGDHVIVELQSISKGTYTFYKTISSPGGAQSGNPIGNFSGNVLGMFKAYSSSTIEMTITEEHLQ